MLQFFSSSSSTAGGGLDDDSGIADEMGDTYGGDDDDDDAHIKGAAGAGHELLQANPKLLADQDRGQEEHTFWPRLHSMSVERRPLRCLFPTARS